MAFSFDVSELRTNRSIQFSSTGDRTSITWTNEYQVIVSVTGGDTLDDTNPYDVITASGLPIVNSSIYYFAGEVIPFVICRDKQATQDAGTLARWIVKCKYKSFDGNQAESGFNPITPPAAIAGLGTSEQPSLGEIEKVLYEDKAGAKVLLPSGAFYAEPLMERIPVLTVKLTQYESSLTYEQMLARKFKVNDATYRSQAAGKWLIEHVEASEVSVELAAGPTTAVLVTYTLVHSPLDEGWKKPLALIDYKVLSGGKFVPYLDDTEPPTQSLVFVTSTGAKKVSQTVPDYVEYEIYDDITFSSFLLA